MICVRYPVYYTTAQMFWVGKIFKMFFKDVSSAFIWSKIQNCYIAKYDYSLNELLSIWVCFEMYFISCDAKLKIQHHHSSL